MTSRYALCIAGALALALLLAALPAAAADPGRIAFSTDHDDGWGGIYLMNTDGSGQVQLTDDSIYGISPAWSPDGSRIAFAGYDPNDPNIPTLRVQIYIMNADGSGLVRLTDGDIDHRCPTWSPDGSRIAFEGSNSWSESSIWVIDADGTDPVNLTLAAGLQGIVANEAMPSWSPDGTRIAYNNRTIRSLQEQIWSMNADGTGRTLLRDLDQDLFSPPAWSPDGTRIAYAFFGTPQNQEGIHVMNADGTGDALLPGSIPWDRDPAWSPDGTRIVFHYDGNLHVMNADGTGRARLGSSGGYERTPAWGITPPPAPSLDLEVEVSVDGGATWQDADSAPGPTLAPGTDPRFRFTVTNTGNVTLRHLSVLDSQVGVVQPIAPWALLPPNASARAIADCPWAQGSYAATATATADWWGTAASDTDASHYYANAPPVVDAGGDLQGVAGVPVVFSGTFADPGDTGTHTIAWEFGDGSTAQGTLTPTHAYAHAGTYTVNLTVTDSSGMAGKDSLNATILDPPPVASFTANATTGTAPLTVQFHDTSTGFFHTRTWDFGDGATSTVADPVHTFAMPGTYDVRLTVTGGGADSAGTTITALAPVASFVANPDSGHAPLTVQFTDTSTGWPTAWTWYFGNGETSTAQCPAYTYHYPGRYTVTLTITAPAGTATHETTVVVQEAPTPRPTVTDPSPWETTRTPAPTATPTPTVTPTSPDVVPLPGFGMPTDPDGDGRYDDVNGNGVADFADIVLYFNHLSWIAQNEPLAAFDYNGNGGIDFADVCWLFNHL